jgi:S1-C subfamily serine protease
LKQREKLEIISIIILSFTVGIFVTFNFDHMNATDTSVNPESVSLKTNFENSADALSVDSQNHSLDFFSINDYENLLTGVFESVNNSVVQITSQYSVVNNHIIINGSPLESQSTHLGSGLVYDTFGHIITNAHVVENAEKVDVTFVDGNSYAAEVIGKDDYADIAVLKIIDDYSDETLHPLTFGDSSQLHVGQQVIAIGNPFGLSNTMTTGIVSQTGRILPNGKDGFSNPNVIQTDAAINPGNSGGPLLNLFGEVIGINTAIRSTTGEFSGVGFAISSNMVMRVVPDLIEKGIYAHPWIGIVGSSLNHELTQKLDLPNNYKGVMVSSVVKDSPADKAGLEEATYNANGELKDGDVIISIDKNPVKGMDDIITYIAENKSVGDEITLTINRHDNLIDFKVILGERP